MNQKKIKQIKRYAKLRFVKEGITGDLLVDIYKKSPKTNQDIFDSEMDTYLKAVKDKKIKAGQSILHAITDVD